MTRRVVITACRSYLVAILVAVMVVPAYASHCPSCLLGQGECLHSRAKADQGPQSEPAPAPRSYCQRQATQAPVEGADDAVCGTEAPVSGSCACCQQRHERTVPSDRAALDLQPVSLAALAAAAPWSIDTDSDDSLRVATRLAELTPPVPHRILHCAWLI